MYDALNKRKVLLDALMEGLEIFRVKELIRLFPELFREYFSPSSSISAAAVIGMLCPEAGVHMSPERLRVWSYLVTAIEKLDSQGMCA